MVEDITPLVITYNEAPNLARTLNSLVWAGRILVVDSGSTDDTLQIARSYAQVEIRQRPFDDFASQCNFGISQVNTGWVLSLDADYELSKGLVEELRSLRAERDIDGYQARFIYRIYGRALRSSLYPPRVVLYRRENAHYHNEGHGHRVSVQGRVAQLKNPIFHDDRKPLSRWFASQQQYATREADFLLSAEPVHLGGADRIRRAGWPAPLGVLFYVLILRGCLLDGWPGWFYALQRLVAETMIALEVVDRRLRRDASD